MKEKSKPVSSTVWFCPKMSMSRGLGASMGLGMVPNRFLSPAKSPRSATVTPSKFSVRILSALMSLGAYEHKSNVSNRYNKGENVWSHKHPKFHPQSTGAFLTEELNSAQNLLFCDRW